MEGWNEGRKRKEEGEWEDGARAGSEGWARSNGSGDGSRADRNNDKKRVCGSTACKRSSVGR